MKTRRFFAQNDPYWVISGRHKPSYAGQLSVLLMRLEVQAFIYQAASNLEGQIGSSPLFTIHDSLVVSEKVEKTARKALRVSFEQVVGFSPLLKKNSLYGKKK